MTCKNCQCKDCIEEYKDHKYKVLLQRAVLMAGMHPNHGTDGNIKLTDIYDVSSIIRCKNSQLLGEAFELIELLRRSKR